MNIKLGYSFVSHPESIGRMPMGPYCALLSGHGTKVHSNSEDRYQINDAQGIALNFSDRSWIFLFDRGFENC